MSTSADEGNTPTAKPEAPSTLTLYADGPIQVKGDFDLIGRDGEPLASGRKTVFLCRCGLSANKPFCDGGHTAGGFTDAVADAT